MVADGSLPSPRIHDPAQSLKSKSLYVLDTSVLVHDPAAFSSFRGTTVGIPIFVVMELDELKNSRRQEVAASARAASRFISSLREFGRLGDPDGVYHPDLETRFLIIDDGSGGPTQLAASTSRRKMDVLILASATRMKARAHFEKVVLVSKDVNLRILADVEGINAEDYNRDRVHVNDVFTGYTIVGAWERGIERAAYDREHGLAPAELGLRDLVPKQFVVLRAPDRPEVLLRYDHARGALFGVAKEFPQLEGVQPGNVEQRMALQLLLDPEVELLTLIGKAGTGKTFLALAAALAQLHGGRGYDRILLSKPVVSMGQDIGYLPGDLEAKMQPWMCSFFDNLDQLISTGDEARSKGADRRTKGWEYLFQTGELEVQPIHSIRGRSIPNAFMLIDEAQNLTPHEVKTIITRAAKGTKVILAGDPFQCDNHFLDSHSNGLVHVTERVKESPFTGSVFFTRGERSRLAELAATVL